MLEGLLERCTFLEACPRFCFVFYMYGKSREGPEGEGPPPCLSACVAVVVVVVVSGRMWAMNDT